ncbi:hypothetical protein OC844_008006, partial [Tilletia horrida]
MSDNEHDRTFHSSNSTDSAAHHQHAEGAANLSGGPIDEERPTRRVALPPRTAAVAAPKAPAAPKASAAAEAPAAAVVPAAAAPQIGHASGTATSGTV